MPAIRAINLLNGKITPITTSNHGIIQACSNMKPIFFFIAMFFSVLTNGQAKESYYKAASDFYEQKNYQKAIDQINLALQSDSTRAEYLLLKGNAQYSLKLYQPAFETFTKLIKFHPNDAIAFNQRGLLLNTIAEFEYAIRDFDMALQLNNPDSIRLSLLINRGAAKVSIRDFNGAYNDFMSAYKIDSLNIGTLNNLASVCDEVGKGDLTFKYLFKILDIDSTFIGAWGNIGFKYQEMGDYKKAVQYFDKVLSLDPEEALAYNNRGFNRLKLGDYKGAMTDVEKSIKLYPSNSFAFKNRALIYIAQNKYREACTDLDRALELGFTKMYGKEAEDLKFKYCTQKSQ